MNPITIQTSMGPMTVSTDLTKEDAQVRVKLGEGMFTSVTVALSRAQVLRILEALTIAQAEVATSELYLAKYAAKGGEA